LACVIIRCISNAHVWQIKKLTQKQKAIILKLKKKNKKKLKDMCSKEVELSFFNFKEILSLLISTQDRSL
jgi:hypothetical protein